MITVPKIAHRIHIPRKKDCTGETSLAVALVNGDWVTAHERMKHDRPTSEVEVSP